MLNEKLAYLFCLFVTLVEAFGMYLLSSVFVLLTILRLMNFHSSQTCDAKYVDLLFKSLSLLSL